MKIKQIGHYDGDIISTILRNRNIEDLELFLNPTGNDDLNPFKLTNMGEAVKVVLAHLRIGNKIGILCDPDADGFSSSSILYQYLKAVNPSANLVYFLHDSKSHGLTDKIMDKVTSAKLDLLVVPDAGSNDERQLMLLYYMGLETVVIDHHEIEHMPEYGIIINNQLEHNIETNKNLVGAGMVLKFCQACDTVLERNISWMFYDLVAIGQIGDASDTSQNEVRNIVKQGINDIRNPFVRTVLEDHFSGDISSIASKDLSFSIIPLINSVVRVGTMEEKELLFRALNSIGDHETFNVIKKKKNKETGKFDQIHLVQNLYEYTLDVCKKVKGRQAALVKKTMEKLGDNTDNSGGIVIGLLEPTDEGSITGLVANKLSSKYQKPALLLHLVNEKYVGSGRGNEKVIPSLKDWCNQTELVDFAQGHANAFGISIPEENFEKFKSLTKNIDKKEFIYEVDAIIDGKVDKHLILDVVENKHLFGGKVHEPLIAFTGININKQFIRQRGSVLTFFEKGIEFIMFSSPAGLYDKLTQNFDRFIKMDFVGTPSVSNFGNKITPQLVLKDCEKSEIKDEPEVVNADNIIF